MNVVLFPLLPMCKYSLLIVSTQVYLLFLVFVVQAVKTIFILLRGVAFTGIGLRSTKNEEALVVEKGFYGAT
jgi:hypothetical protein